MRKFIFILGGLCIAALVGVVILISQVDVSQYREQALTEVEKATGRRVSIDGKLDLAVSLTPAIVAEGVRLANADWGSRADMASIRRVEVQVALLPLLSGNVEVKRFVLVEPDILLEKNAAGTGNWETGVAAGGEQSGSSEMPPLTIGTVLVEKLTLVYRDPAREKPVEFHVDSLKLDSVPGDQLAIALQADLDNTPIAVDGFVGKPEVLFANGKYPLDITVNIGDAKSTLKGVISKPLQGEGLDLVTSFNVARLDQLNALTGSELPDMGPLALTARISDADNRYNLGDLQLTLADTRLSGEISVDTRGKVPDVRARLQAPMIDLQPFQPLPADNEKVTRYLSDEPLPLEGLRAINADLALKINEVRTRQALLSNVETRVKLQDGLLVVKPLSLQVAGGTLNGNVKLDATQKIAGLAVNLEGRKIQLGQLEPLKDKLSGGPTDLGLHLTGIGNTTQTIAGTAHGNLLVNVRSAVLTQEKGQGGFLAGLGELLNPFSRQDNSMLDCAVLNFQISDGIATADRGIGIETRQITVSGGGEINLKNEQLALGFEPSATGVVAGTITNLASGMKATGTLADPKISINPAGVAMGAIKSVAGVASGVAGGAASIVGGLFGKNDATAKTRDTAPCQTALSGKMTPAEPAPAKSATTNNTSPAQAESLPEKILDTPKKLLQGLFD